MGRISEAALSCYSFLADKTNKIQKSGYSRSLQSSPPGPGVSGSVTIELLHKRTAGNGKDFIVGTLPFSIVPVRTG